jgi:hypothetical protein
MNTPAPSDTSVSVASAVSPEETIARLQEERDKLETQNAHLWRLCDKQREMYRIIWYARAQLT